ncbi:hypothetical protein [Nitrososphaera sp. AFS]|uniref:hypothetical protein n=1 Tax=Nitrososphaera sp. AFS TaxID=2301191 RepID=UPI0013922BD5|nr:hypothetical protein [Nitrososphaera sp. AFS]
MRVGKSIITPPDCLRDFEPFLNFVYDGLKKRYTMNDASLEAIDIFLYVCLKDKQQLIWCNYMTDLEKELPSAVLEINFLIHDPKIEYFVVACGNMRQAYNNSTLDIYIDRDYSGEGILSVLGKSRGGKYINNTYSLVRDATSRALHLKKIFSDGN